MKSEKFVRTTGTEKIGAGCVYIFAASVIAFIVGFFFWPIAILIFLVGLIAPFFQNTVKGICPKCEKPLFAVYNQDSVKCRVCKSVIIIDQQNNLFKYLDN